MCTHTKNYWYRREAPWRALSLFPSAPFSSSHEGTICPVTARILPPLLRCETWCVWLPGLAGEVSQCSLLLWTGMGKKSPRACPERCAEGGSCSGPLSLSLSAQLFESLEFRLCVARVTLNKATALIHRDTLIAPAELCWAPAGQWQTWPDRPLISPSSLSQFYAPNRLCHSVFNAFVSLCRRPEIGKLNINCQNTECRSQCILSVFNGTQRKGLLGLYINRARFV